MYMYNSQYLSLLVDDYKIIIVWWAIYWLT